MQVYGVLKVPHRSAFERRYQAGLQLLCKRPETITNWFSPISGGHHGPICRITGTGTLIVPVNKDSKLPVSKGVKDVEARVSV